MAIPERLPDGGGATLHSIQCMRFVAATVVVIYHAYITSVPVALIYPTLGAAYVFGFGKVGVHIFFVISGYIMYLTSFGRAGHFRAGQFFLRRVIRIYPIYWIFVAVYLAGTALIGAMPRLSLDQFLGALALAPGSAPMVIGPAWTLSFEVYFYMIFGIIMVLGAFRGAVSLTLIFVASILAGSILHPGNPFIGLATNPLLLEFCMGVWVARLTISHRLPQSAGWAAVVSAIGLYAAGLIWGYDRMPSAIIWGVPSALLICGMVILEQRGRATVMRRLSWLGDSSYVLYLCHVLLITLTLAVLQRVDMVVPLAVLLTVMTVGCVIFAALFHAAIERPLTSRLHRAILHRKPSSSQRARVT